jgi:hypothetical protein
VPIASFGGHQGWNASPQFRWLPQALREIDMTKRNTIVGLVVCFTIAGSSGARAQRSVVDDGGSFKKAAAPQVAPPFKLSKPLVGSKVHWSLDAAADSFAIKEGILMEKGEPKDRPLIIAGVDEQPPAALRQKLAAIDDLSPTEQHSARVEWSAWQAEHFGKDLSAGSRKELVDLYVQRSRSADPSLPKNAPEKLDSLNENDRQERLKQESRDSLDFLIAERKIIGSDRAAQLRRYGKVLPPLAATLDRRALELDLNSFLSGKYVDAEVGRVKGPDREFLRHAKSYIPRVGGREGFIVISPRTFTVPDAVRTWIPKGKCARLGSFTRTQIIEGPFVIESEGRVFVAEHPITGSSWEDIGLPNLYHTSLVGGLWNLIQTKSRSISYKCDVLDVLPVETGRTEVVQTQLQFDRWVVANSCAGTYKASDELREVYRTSRNSPDSVIKVLRGVRADSNGKRCRTRYGAFPNGSYGLQWVCHQACNTFAKTKWSIVPIHYSVSSVPFGDTGNWGVTDIKAPCECAADGYSANHCCVPGSGCCMNNTYGQGSGNGYGMSVGWHPTKGWIDTECKFDSVAVPIPGWDYPAVTIDIMTMVIVD